MKKIIALVIAMMLIVAMAAPASACTMKFKIPGASATGIPTFEYKLPADFWDNLNAKYGNNN